MGMPMAMGMGMEMGMDGSGIGIGGAGFGDGGGGDRGVSVRASKRLASVGPSARPKVVECVPQPGVTFRFHKEDLIASKQVPSHMRGVSVHMARHDGFPSYQAHRSGYPQPSLPHQQQQQPSRFPPLRPSQEQFQQYQPPRQQYPQLQPPFIATPPFTSGRNSGASGFEETLSPPPQESPIPPMPSQPMREGPGLLGMMQQHQYQQPQQQQQQYAGREESKQVQLQQQQPLQVQQVAAPAAAAAAASAGGGGGGGRVSGGVVGVSGQVASNVLGKEVRPQPQPPRGIGAPAGAGLGMGRQVHATGRPQPPSDREVITIDLEEDEEEPTGEQQQPSGTGRGAFAATAPPNAAARVQESREVYRLEEDIEKLEQEMATMRIVGERKKIWDLRKRTGVPAKAPWFLKVNDEETAAALQLLEEGQEKGESLTVAEVSGIPVLGYDIVRLEDLEWLNDEIVNITFALAERWLKEQAAAGKPVPKVWIPNSFFWQKLSNPSAAGFRYDYNSVRRWSTKKKVNVFELDYVIVPINEGYPTTGMGYMGTHWALGVVDIKNKRIRVLDSLGGGGTNWRKEENEKFYEFILQYLKDEHRDKLKKPMPDAHLWAKQSETNLPQQTNGCDCGVFMLLHGLAFVCNSSFDDIDAHRCAAFATRLTGDHNTDQLNLISLVRKKLILSIRDQNLPLEWGGEEGQPQGQSASASASAVGR
mmetsp:Transcript_28015/g.80640  ORF Transcript_28015/g.80640 Transcript_28015/m.80640 type:complete len:704 (+) Transcript_28015:44-2155(+)